MNAVRPFVLQEALASVALSHADDCGCDTCKAASGDEEALSRVLGKLWRGER
jgi:hypothetical protein